MIAINTSKNNVLAKSFLVIKTIIFKTATNATVYNIILLESNFLIPDLLICSSSFEQNL